jgi:hypothetical protein
MTDNQRCDAIEYPALCYPMEGRPTWCGEHVARFTPPAAVPPTDGTNPSDEFIRGSISGAKNAVATERLRRKLMPSDDGALVALTEQFRREIAGLREAGGKSNELVALGVEETVNAYEAALAKPTVVEGEA